MVVSNTSYYLMALWLISFPGCCARIEFDSLVFSAGHSLSMDWT